MRMTTTAALPADLDFSKEQELILPVRAHVRMPKGADPNEPVITIVGNAETADSFDTAFVQKGMDARRFRENPVFLRQHESWELPLGIAEKWWVETIKVRMRGQRKRVDRPATLFQIRFDVADDPEDDDEDQKLARRYLERYRRSMLRGASIRFSIPPGGAEFADKLSDEEREYYGLSEFGVLFRKWELIELSAVTLPSNEHSLLVRSARGGSPCTPAEFQRMRTELDALRHEVTELRSLARDDPESSAGESPESAPAEGPDPASASRSDPGASPAGPSDTALERFARLSRPRGS